MLRSLLIALFFPPLLLAQSPITPTDSLYLRVVLPERDTVRTPFSRSRIAASTLPMAKAFINGKETKVYPTGAFVGLVQIPIGTSSLRLSVIGPKGDSLWREFTLVRPEPMKSSPTDELVIDPAMMEPSQDLWLMSGDMLEVRMKGSPGYEASFSIDGVESGIPMRELPTATANGIAGIYVGRYKVKDGDASGGYPIKFKLKRSFFSWETAYSKGKVWMIPDSLPRVAEIVGRRPFLNVGLGTDRLGGAKLGFLQPGVLVEVTGKVGSQYRVHLSEGMDAWLPDDHARLLSPEVPLPHSLIGSISVSGTDSVDIVSISLSQKLPYTSEQLVDPTGIVVDVHGATSNTNWITHQRSARGIESVKWTQVAADRYRLTIKLNFAQHWGYDIDYLGTSLRVKVRRPPVIRSAAAPLTGMIIAVDAGHGGDNHGALGATGVQEMDVNLAIARRLDSVLTAHGATVVMTRTNDEGPSMSERTDRVISSGAQILVSIHCNSTGDISDPLAVQGVSTYYRYVGFKPLAETLYDEMLELGLKQWGVTGSFNFALNGPTQLPNALVETAFLSHPEDEMLLLDNSFRERIAENISKGLEAFVLKFGARSESAKIGSQ